MGTNERSRPHFFQGQSNGCYGEGQEHDPRNPQHIRRREDWRASAEPVRTFLLRSFSQFFLHMMFLTGFPGATSVADISVSSFYSRRSSWSSSLALG